MSLRAERSEREEKTELFVAAHLVTVELSFSVYFTCLDSSPLIEEAMVPNMPCMLFAVAHNLEAQFANASLGS